MLSIFGSAPRSAVDGDVFTWGSGDTAGGPLPLHEQKLITRDVLAALGHGNSKEQRLPKLVDALKSKRPR